MDSPSVPATGFSASPVEVIAILLIISPIIASEVARTPTSSPVMELLLIVAICAPLATAIPYSPALVIVLSFTVSTVVPAPEQKTADFFCEPIVFPDSSVILLPLTMLTAPENSVSLSSVLFVPSGSLPVVNVLFLIMQDSAFSSTVEAVYLPALLDAFVT